jgi:hypothetical protein
MDLEDCRKLWGAAKDFSDLITLNQKFLLGQIPETPYYRGEIFEETNPLIPGLLKLQDFGLFTISSQPYEHEVFEKEGKWIEVQQKPYVSFLLPTKGAPYLELFKRLKDRANVAVSAQELCPSRVVDGSHDTHEVTRSREADTDKGLETAEWMCDIAVGGESDMSFVVPEIFPAMEPVKPVWFDVAVNEWGVQLDLLALIEEVAVEIGWFWSS